VNSIKICKSGQRKK